MRQAHKKLSWTPEDEQVLIDNYPDKKSVRELAQLLGRTEISIANRIHLLRGKGLINPERKVIINRVGAWTPEETLFLVENYNKLSFDELTKYLGRSKTSITDKVHALKVRSDMTNINKPRPESWTAADKDFLWDNYYSMSVDELSEKLGRSKHAIQQMFYRLINAPH